jgi:ribonuclease Z
VTLTGTGVPHASPGRAGSGTLVQSGDVALQFDAGRGTVLRLAEAGVHAAGLDAVFVTHVHSDHVVDLSDVTMTRWIEGALRPAGILPIVCPTGATSRFVARMLEPFDEDIALRMAHVGVEALHVEPTSFRPAPTPEVVWTSTDGAVVVSAVAVHHEPVEAVAYRVDTPDGAVVISGDTRVCSEVERLASGAAVMVHEACRRTALADAIAGTVFETIFSYHADTVELGGMAERAGVTHLVLTHLIPAPDTAEDEAAFEAEVRAGGYTGRVTVGRDLATVALSDD